MLVEPLGLAARSFLTVAGGDGEEGGIAGDAVVDEDVELDCLGSGSDAPLINIEFGLLED
jgi:hypothetical protein